MNRGYVKIFRKIEDSGILGNAEVCQLFMYLMIKATRRPRKVMAGTQLIKLQPGQFFAGRKQLAQELDSTERKIRTALSTLQKMEIIDQQTTSRGTVISLINWGKYQDERPAGDQHIDQVATSTRPGGDQVATTKQDIKNISIKKEDPSPVSIPGSLGEASPPSPAPGEGDLGSGDFINLEFEKLRAYYDKHIRPEAPRTGWAEYKQLKAARAWPGQNAIYDALDQYAAAYPTPQDKSYVPGLARWLREGWWKKKPEPRARAAPKGAAPDWVKNGGLDPTIARNMATAERVLQRRSGNHAPE